MLRQSGTDEFILAMAFVYMQRARLSRIESEDDRFVFFALYIAHGNDGRERLHSFHTHTHTHRQMSFLTAR
jgi:hypothetical protein